MAERCLELLALPAGKPAFLLDLGCGSGLGGTVFERQGHLWAGMDISGPMLAVAKERQSCNSESSEMSGDESYTANDDSSVASDDDSEVTDCSDDSDGDDSLDDDHDRMTDDEASGVTDSGCCSDLLLGDMGEGVPFRAGTFDGCVSVSALQWLCHSNRSHERPRARLARLFNTLFGALSRGARAIFQLYPENTSQIDLILGCATKAGFSGGLLVD